MVKGAERGASFLDEQAEKMRTRTTDNAPSSDWPRPQPLAAKMEPEPYPLDALPDTIRAAVEEVAGFVKAPLPLVANSALAALSLAGQAHIDVKRAEKLHGPSGLFLLTIADSGERKSTCDGFFFNAIREWEQGQAESMKPDTDRYAAESAAWNVEREGVLQAIREAGRKGDDETAQKRRNDLAGMREPESPRVPRLFYADATPEALAHGLAHKWPSGGVVSSEAGIVFGSHAMGRDSIMRNLVMLNQLWDGTPLTIDRKTSESFTGRGARLTIALQVQEPTLREFVGRSGELARGIGFLARFLIAWPESTQGQRLFTEAPANWPHLAAFHRRIVAILETPALIDADGALSPALLPMTPEAKIVWIAFHDEVEWALCDGGELCDVRDVASKTADNAARLAGLFCLFGGNGEAIGLTHMQSAARIVAWHLSEARRFFGEMVLPVELADAARLDKWLLDHCRREKTCLVGKSRAMQYSPIRNKARLDSAITELSDLDRLAVRKSGKQIILAINPRFAGRERRPC